MVGVKQFSLAKVESWTDQQVDRKSAGDRIPVVALVGCSQLNVQFPSGFGKQPVQCCETSSSCEDRHLYLSEKVNAEMRLQQRVHVTCGTLVFQRNKARFLL